MIKPKFFFEQLTQNNIDFFCGVPDSLLKDFCAYVTDNAEFNKHFITANEGAAIGLAAGYNMATKKYPLIYMQNSGLGNAVNPLLSLADSEVYSIPMVLLIGWRGEPGVKDEPQHIKQGKVTLDMLDAMGVKYLIMADNENDLIDQIHTCIDNLNTNKAPFAFVVKKQTFDSYKLTNVNENTQALSREEAIEIVADILNTEDIIVSTTGMISRELYEYRDKKGQGHHQDFLTVGSMGHASQIAFGIALQKPNRRVFCFDGDGSTIMHMGSLAIIGCQNLSNFIHIVFNNNSHDSVGGQPTVGFKINLPAVASACGYANYYSVTTKEDIINTFNSGFINGSTFIEVKVNKGARQDLGRPKTSPINNKESFMSSL